MRTENCTAIFVVKCCIATWVASGVLRKLTDEAHVHKPTGASHTCCVGKQPTAVRQRDPGHSYSCQRLYTLVAVLHAAFLYEQCQQLGMTCVLSTYEFPLCLEGNFTVAKHWIPEP